MHSSLGVELLAGESQVEPEVGRDRGRRALVGSSVTEPYVSTSVPTVSLGIYRSQSGLRSEVAHECFQARS
jgi:hypothetical protein